MDTGAWMGTSMGSLEECMAEALWIAWEPWRQNTFRDLEPITWADADDLDRELYRTRAKVVIEQLGLTEETRTGWADADVIEERRFVSKWWETA